MSFPIICVGVGGRSNTLLCPSHPPWFSDEVPSARWLTQETNGPLEENRIWLKSVCRCASATQCHRSALIRNARVTYRQRSAEGPCAQLRPARLHVVKQNLLLAGKQSSQVWVSQPRNSAPIHSQVNGFDNTDQAVGGASVGFTCRNWPAEWPDVRVWYASADYLPLTFPRRTGPCRCNFEFPRHHAITLLLVTVHRAQATPWLRPFLWPDTLGRRWPPFSTVQQRTGSDYPHWDRWAVSQSLQYQGCLSSLASIALNEAAACASVPF